MKETRSAGIIRAALVTPSDAGRAPADRALALFARRLSIYAARVAAPPSPGTGRELRPTPASATASARRSL